LAVVVSNGVTTYRMSGVSVLVRPDNSDETLKDVSDHEGATFFSFKSASQFDVIVEEKGFDPVSFALSCMKFIRRFVHTKACYSVK
jgi:hypothetical protein